MVQCCALLINAGSRLWTCHIWFRAWLFSSKTCKCKTWCRRTVQHQETGENNIFLNGHVLHILTLSIWPIFLHHSASTLVYSSPVQSTLGGSILNLYNRSIRPSVHSSILFVSIHHCTAHACIHVRKLECVACNYGNHSDFYGPGPGKSTDSLSQFDSNCRTAKYCQTWASIWSGCKSGFESSSA